MFRRPYAEIEITGVRSNNQPQKSAHNQALQRRGQNKQKRQQQTRRWQETHILVLSMMLIWRFWAFFLDYDRQSMAEETCQTLKTHTFAIGIQVVIWVVIWRFRRLDDVFYVVSGSLLPYFGSL